MYKINETQTVTVFTNFDGIRKIIEYSSIEELMQKVNQYLTEPCRYRKVLDVDYKNGIEVTSTNLNFYWNCTVSHYCFTKGRIDEVEAFEMMNNEEGGAK